MCRSALLTLGKNIPVNHDHQKYRRKTAAVSPPATAKYTHHHSDTTVSSSLGCQLNKPMDMKVFFSQGSLAEYFVVVGV